ncbi:AAA family ATPase [Haloimpatiens sp. FM7330]|uniref:AAA family ATPase n=1 Tax=Haloimpatiens sp. FM7330 TaxID=3298610 RepID=UPI00363A47F6
MDSLENKKIELCYVWLEEYKAFKDAEFNFSNKVNFHKKDNSIEISKKTAVENFFGNNITNITAIVGKNGDGKTTIIEFLNEFFYVRNYIKNRFVVILKEEKYKIYYKNDIEPIIDNNMDAVYYKCDSEDIVLPQSLATIFFSNIFDKNTSISNQGHSKYVNVSTNSLIRNVRDNRGAFQLTSDIELFENEEFKREFEFLDKYNTENIKLPYDFMKWFPNRLEINLNESVLLTKREGSVNDGEFFSKIQKYIFDKVYSKFEYDLLKSQSFQEVFERLYSGNCIDNFFKEIYEDRRILFPNLRYDKINRISAQNLENQFGDKEKEIEKIKNDVIKNWDEFKPNQTKINFDYCIEIFKKLKETFRKLKDEFGKFQKSDGFKIYSLMLENYDKQIEVIENNIKLTKMIRKKISKNNLKRITSLIVELEVGKVYTKCFIEVGWLNTYWARDKKRLSSGENALLNMYSRFYYAKQKIQEGCKNLIILMDEPELYFHPEWQRGLISYLIDFLKNVFREYNIQVIMTSNSSYIISDLPKENIIFLEKENEQCKVCDNKNFKQTFGANIHTLLTNSFFLQNTIGEFANQNIKDSLKIMDKYKQFNDSKIRKTEFKEEYIKYMGCKENEEISIEEMKKKIKYIIKIIGEPLIKRKLEEIYRTTFPEDREDYELEIKKLQQEKGKLQEIIKEKGLDNIEGIMKLLEQKIRELEEKAGDGV